MRYLKLKDVNFNENIGNRVFVKFMARDVDVRTQKDGVTKYITLNVCDKDIVIDAKKFGATDAEISQMRNGCIYNAAIDIKEYAKSPTGYSLIIYNFELTNESPSEYVEWAEGMEHAYNVIQSTLNEISESIYRDLVCDLIIENWDKFSVWTAASSWHHNVLGGLLVHSTEVVEQADKIAEFWEQKYGPNFINRPLLLSAALIHDIAKTKELNVDVLCGSTEYAVQASLESHITMCVSMIDVQATKKHFGVQIYRQDEDGSNVPVKSEEQLKEEQEALSLLKHCILSHHGKQEYGSPITPHIPEATIINIADNLSAEMYRYNKTFNNIEPGESETVWQNGQMVVTYKDSTKA